MSAQPQLSLLPLVPASLARPRRVALTNPEAECQAETRLQVITPLLDYKADALRFSSLRLQDGTPVTSFTRLVKHVSETSGLSEGTLFNWLNAFREGGLPALADRQRRDKNTSRFFAAYPKAAWLAAYLFLEERMSVRVAHEAIVRDLQLLEIPPEDAPSYETVRAWLKQMPAALTVYARQGRKVYRERMAAYLRRGYTDVWANQVWVGDHMIHDVECANDLFEDVEWGAPIRVRLSAMLDYRSRMLVGASWAWEGSSRAIAATMRRAILQYGPPEGVYFDNGKDYLKVAKGARRGCEGYLAESPLAPDHWWQSELEGIERTGFLARLGISATHCIARHPQSKHVERWFRTLHTRFDSVHSTYTSGSPFTRPDRTESAMMQHRRLFKKGRAAESEHPAASRFILGCLSWIEEYNATPHRGQGMDGRSPNEVFEQDFNPNQKPTPEAATLALLMAEYEKRQVRECAVTLRKRRYMPRPEDRLAWAAMDEANEREILIAYDPADLDFAAALDLDGRFLAWLEAEVLLRFAPGDPETQARIGDSMQTRRGLEKAHKQTLKEIAATARADGARSAEEMLYGRLQLPAVTGAVITQRKPGMRPDKEAVAPMSAADIAANLLRDLGWEKAV